MAVIEIEGKLLEGQQLEIRVDGELVDLAVAQPLMLKVTGDLAKLTTNLAASVQGHIHGDVKVGEHLSCANVDGDVEAAGDVTCGDVTGDVEAGRDVNCVDVEGSVDAGRDVFCGSVSGTVEAGNDVACTTVAGNVRSAGDIFCTDVEGRQTTLERLLEERARKDQEV
jgi:hypothetical protein